MIKTLSFLAALGLASFSQTNGETNLGTAGCACTSVCKVRGDSQVENIWGESFSETKEEFTLFEGYGLDIYAKTFGRFYLGEVTIGGTQTDHLVSYNAYNCFDIGAFGGPRNYTQGQTTVTLQVECDKNSQSGGPNGGFFLNVAELRITSGSDPLEEIDARGVCVEHREEEMGNAVDTVEFGKNNTGPVCECVESTKGMLRGTN